jgi:hypothetical protein
LRLHLHALMWRSENFISAHIKNLIIANHLGIKSKTFTCWKFCNLLTGSLCRFPMFTSFIRHVGIFAFFEIDLSH